MLRYGTLQKANTKGPGQSARMRRLVCAFVVRKPPETGFLAHFLCAPTCYGTLFTGKISDLCEVTLYILYFYELHQILPYPEANNSINQLQKYIGKYTHCILMDSSFWFDTISLGQSIVHILGCKVIVFLKKYCILLSEDLFNLYKQCWPWWKAALCCISSGLHKYSRIKNIKFTCTVCNCCAISLFFVWFEVLHPSQQLSGHHTFFPGQACRLNGY